MLAFYDIDAAPEHSVADDLAERLGGVTDLAGFIDGAIFVRSDTAAVMVQLQHDGGDEWIAQPEVAAILDAAEWRSRTSETAAYHTVRVFESGGDEPSDGSVFVVQRFAVTSTSAREFLAALEAYVEKYPQAVTGFLGATLFASNRPDRAVLVTAWAYEAGLTALETPASLAAMHSYRDLAEQQSFGTYQRVSYLRGGGVAS